MKNRIALIIPYFGRIPDYFDLWLKSARSNSQFDFLFFSDLPLNLNNTPNVHQISVTFRDLKKQIEKKFDRKICLKNPYKLCDYRPVYGYLFEEYLKEYDFWGFTDVDMILGDLSRYVNDRLLNDYDKLFYQGHFSLFRNCEKMNKLFLRCYPHVMNWKYAFGTNYACHFDENGTVAWAHEVDQKAGIRFYTAWDFLDVPINHYELCCGGKDGYAIWNNGHLYFCGFGETYNAELMYIHLQKRKMSGIYSTEGDCFAIARTTFYNKDDKQCYANPDYDEKHIGEFIERRKHDRHKEIVTNLQNGAIKAKFFRIVLQWKAR